MIVNVNLKITEDHVITKFLIMSHTTKVVGCNKKRAKRMPNKVNEITCNQFKKRAKKVNVNGN